MSREIKFRAWDKKNKKMLELGDGNFCFTDCGFCFEGYKFGIDASIGGVHLKLMQFTGLKDKNGKEIFEGDIVETFNAKKKKLIAGIWKIHYNDLCGSFDGERISNRKDDSGEDFEIVGNLESDDCVIIGNICENLELLEKK